MDSGKREEKRELGNERRGITGGTPVVRGMNEAAVPLEGDVLSAIEWTEATWNPMVGCSKVSAGCKHCYAEVMARRLAAIPATAGVYGQVVHGAEAAPSNRGRWNGRVVLNPSTLRAPLRRKRSTMYFVNSMSDLFHESVTDEMLDQVFGVMLAGWQHTYQVLTKRPERMREYMSGLQQNLKRRMAVVDVALDALGEGVQWDKALQAWKNNDLHGAAGGLWHVWLGTSVEDQAAYRERVPHLLATPAAVRFLSCEPLLGPVVFDLSPTRMVRNGEPVHVDPLRRQWCVVDVRGNRRPVTRFPWGEEAAPGIDWVIVGGESGPGSRPMHPEWVRGIRDACLNAGVAFFFKQWGEWAPGVEDVMYKVGKKVAGRVLDGAVWDEMPGEI